MTRGRRVQHQLGIQATLNVCGMHAYLALRHLLQIGFVGSVSSWQEFVYVRESLWDRRTDRTNLQSETVPKVRFDEMAERFTTRATMSFRAAAYTEGLASFAEYGPLGIHLPALDMRSSFEVEQAWSQKLKADGLQPSSDDPDWIANCYLKFLLQLN